LHALALLLTESHGASEISVGGLLFPFASFNTKNLNFYKLTGIYDHSFAIPDKNRLKEIRIVQDQSDIN
jgi:hypothetical protein